MVKKAIMNFGIIICISVVVLKNYEPQFSYILAELFSMHLKEPYFPDCCKVSVVVPVLKNVWKGLQLNTITQLLFFPWLQKSLKKIQIIGC